MSDQLNPPQRKAVRTLSGPLLVLAGAGSGKTRVITFRIVELIRSGIKPNRILAVTFTNKAAKEMRHRAMVLIKGGQKKRTRRAESPEISTFHSLCVRILRRHIDRLGYPREFPIYDAGDQDGLARAALRDIRVGHEKLRPSDLISQIGRWKSAGIRPKQAEAIAKGDQQLLAAAAYHRYQAGLKSVGAVDFDDILLCTEELFENFPDVRFAEATRFDHLLIDEYQDTNGLQYRIVKALAERHRNLCVVGDDDQSIYGFRGAEVTHILGFTKDWPDATVVRLEDNYRSTAAILKLANTLIAHNKDRHQKVLRASKQSTEQPRFCKFDDETTEAEAIAHEIESLIRAEGERRTRPADIAILFRTNEQPRAFEVELRRRRIPYVLVGGMSFYDRKEVRDLLAYLKVLSHPKDEVSLLRIINTPQRGIGTASVQVLLSEAVSRGVPLWQVLPDVMNHPDVGHATSERILAFRQMIDRYRSELGKEPLSQLVKRLISQIEYRRELERLYKTPTDVDARWAIIEELINSIAIYEGRVSGATVQGFLEEIALDNRDDSRDEDGKSPEQAVALMTLHSAKGLEFSRVYLVGMEEGLLPHRRSLMEGSGAIAEERRLAYVGVTRAQDVLTVSLAKQRMKWGKPRPSIVSRFLLEMRGETEKALKAAAAAEEQLARELPPEPEPKKKKGTRKKAVSGKASSPKPSAAKPSFAGPGLTKPGAAKPGAAKPVAAKSAAPNRAVAKQGATKPSGAGAVSGKATEAVPAGIRRPRVPPNDL
jgi:DNA helicase II / ATP-dependent DNA helicase PcrA